jgi:hypothetical protein
MNLASFVLSGIPLLIQNYAEEYRKLDYSSTLAELEGDLGLSRVQSHDFIVGNSLQSSNCLL